jgi:hypothetical protein
MGHAILERVLLFGTRSADYIRASGHNGCIATEVTLQATTEAEYMTAPERFADSQIPLAPRAPSIHDPSLPFENDFAVMHKSGVTRSYASVGQTPFRGSRSL